MPIKHITRICLLFLSVACYAQSPKQPIIKETSVQFLSTQICDCLALKQPTQKSAQETIATCFEDEFMEHGDQILEENNLTASSDLGLQIGQLVGKELKANCPTFLKIQGDRPEQQMADQATALSKAGNVQEALVLFNQLIGKNMLAFDWSLYNDRGFCKLSLGDTYGALADFEYAIQRDSTAAMPYNNRGLAKQKLGDKQGAFDDYTQAIRLDSTQALFYENRGYVFYTANQYDEAKADFKKAVAIQAKSPSSLFYLGTIGRETNNLSDTTLRYFTACIELEPTVGSYYNARGMCHYRRNDSKMARADYTKATQLSPDFNPAYYNLARLDHDAKQWGSALKYINKAIQIDSTEALYHDEQAALLLELKRYSEALAAADRALALKPDKPDYYDTKAAVYEAAGNTQKAIDAYTKSLELYDRDGAIYYRRGKAKLKLNDKAGACADFQLGALFKHDDAKKAAADQCK